MKRIHVPLQQPLGDIDHVHVEVGGLTIERAADLKSYHVARLSRDDRDAIILAMAGIGASKCLR